jgi:hypothetical protein
MTKEEIDNIVKKESKYNCIEYIYGSDDKAIKITSVNCWEYYHSIIEILGFERYRSILYIPSWYVVKMMYSIKHNIPDSVYAVDIEIYNDKLVNHIAKKTSYLYAKQENTGNKYCMPVEPRSEP